MDIKKGLEKVFENWRIKFLSIIAGVISLSFALAPRVNEIWFDINRLKKEDVIFTVMGIMIPASLYYVYFIYKKLSEISATLETKYSQVDVKERTGLNYMLSAIQEAANVSIFLGLDDLVVLKKVYTSLRKRKAPYTLYTNPKVFLKMIDQKILPEKRKAQISDCPDGSCAVYTRSPGGEKRCILLRGKPDSDNYWTVTVKAESRFLSFLNSTYNHYYVKGRNAVLDDEFKKIFFEMIYKDRKAEDKGIFEIMELNFESRKKEYEYAAKFIEKAQESILAVDRQDPEEWVGQEPEGWSEHECGATECFGRDMKQYMKSYVEAHKVSNAEKKKRVYIFDSHAATNKNSYNRFIECQRRLGVDLYFRDAANVQGVISDGFVVIDNKVVFLTHAERPSLPQGRVNFDDGSIKQYSDRFTELLSPALSVDEFRNRYL